MSDPVPVSYTYDGSFDGFLTCVYESYVNKEPPACFSAPGETQLSVYPERVVETDLPHARRVRASLPKALSGDGARMVTYAFLTCLPEREKHIYDLIALGYKRGPAVVRDLTDQRVLVLSRALTHLKGEAHLLKGFTRFSRQEGILVAEIQPKNRVLPLLRAHFCARYNAEPFVLYDRTHREALFYQPGTWVIVPLDEFHVSPPGQEELEFRTLWRRFYDTVAIEGRLNPKLRMTHMPKRYWHTMTELQSDAPSSAGEIPSSSSTPAAAR
ncbi:MAG: TIGR03915 family putative DNA repair protein [Pseudoflavonifractor sp.]